MGRERDLLTHPLVQSVLAASSDLLDSAARRIKSEVKKHGRPRVENPKPPRSVHDRYQHAVFYRVSKVLADFDRLAHSAALLRNLPTPRMLKRWDLTPDRWFEYQYEFHLLTLVGLADRCLLVTNDILRCGLNFRDCNSQTMLRHEKLVGTKIRTALQRLLKEVEPRRAPRNAAVHEGEAPAIRKIIELEDYDWLPIIALAERVRPTTKEHSNVVRRLFQSSAKLLATKMRKDRTQARRRVWRLFDLLKPRYERQSMEYRWRDAASNRLAGTDR